MKKPQTKLQKVKEQLIAFWAAMGFMNKEQTRMFRRDINKLIRLAKEEAND
jgi:hypothetical protein